MQRTKNAQDGAYGETTPATAGVAPDLLEPPHVSSSVNPSQQPTLRSICKQSLAHKQIGGANRIDLRVYTSDEKIRYWVAFQLRSPLSGKCFTPRAGRDLDHLVRRQPL